jgi:hypothetical protein
LIDEDRRMKILRACYTATTSQPFTELVVFECHASAPKLILTAAIAPDPEFSFEEDLMSSQQVR